MTSRCPRLRSLALLPALALLLQAQAMPPSPADIYGPLFAAVQEAQVFPDGKTFADAAPKRAPDAIMAPSHRPGLTALDSGFLDTIRAERASQGAEIRTMGSLSIVRQLLAANLLDRLRLIYCPLILPQSGIEPFFKGMPDQKFELKGHRILDGEVVLLDYRPDGMPHYA